MDRSRLNPVFIEATTIPDSWFQILWNLFDYGKKFVVEKGSYKGQQRLELDFLCVHIKFPSERPLLPDIPPNLGIPPPATENYLNEYMPYLMTPYKRPDEEYTYGSRLVSENIDQIEHVIETYKKHGFRNNQLVMTIGLPEDLKLDDPPCLRLIDTRIQDDKLHFYVYFRSNDIWSGYPVNIAALQLMKEYMCDCIGVGDGEIIYMSKGSHIYEFCFDIAKMRLHK